MGWREIDAKDAAAIEAAIAELERVFPAEPLDVTHAWRNGRSGYLWSERFEAEVGGQRWTEIDPKVLEWHHDALLFLEPAWLVGYLPACVRSVLRGGKELNGLPMFLFRGMLDQRFDELAAVLSRAQQRSIALALGAFVTAWAETPRATEAAEAYEHHWRAIAEGS